ncbi:hypothetical protein Fot_05465 [Forsythia ovata]|uniref:Uncharacterized protein n=1 Tax=Forsythia ovata TaxID=205694 RepID=A0ABD1WPY8_9LAMI
MNRCGHLLGSSSLSKIVLAGLAAKKIPPVLKKNSLNNDQKRILVGLSLKGGEKYQDAHLAPSDLMQTTLIPTASLHDLQIMVQNQELGAIKTEKEKIKGANSDVGGSSKQSLRDKDDMEVLEEDELSKKVRKLWVEGDEGMETDKMVEP